MPAYFAVIHKEEGTAFGVSWPDLPGCVSAADTVGEIDAQAREALQFHIEGLREDGEALPEVSNFGDVYAAHKGDAGFYGVVLVSVPDKVERRPISLRVSEIDLAVIDSAAAAYNLDRTAFMVAASKNAAARNDIPAFSFPATRRAFMDNKNNKIFEYRKKKGSDTWHISSKCSFWPTSNYVCQTEKPLRGEICNECLARMRQ